MEEIVIKTSNPEWVRLLSLAYSNKVNVTLLDDAKLGVDPRVQSLLKMAASSGMSRKQLNSVVVSLGISGVGITLVIAAILDPEPTSSLFLLVTGGLALLTTGSLALLRTFMSDLPTNVSFGKGGFSLGFQPDRNTEIHNHYGQGGQFYVPPSQLVRESPTGNPVEIGSMPRDSSARRF